MNIKVLTFLVAAVGSVTGLTFGAFVWTVRTWAPPSQPVLYLGVAMLMLFGLAGVVWYQVTQDELDNAEGSVGAAQTEGLKRLLGLAGVVVLGVVGLGVMGLWMSPEVRAKLVPYAAEERLQLEAALTDPSPIVREAACLGIFELGVDGSESNLAGSLDPFPEGALACLNQARERGNYGTSRIANRLISGWESQMLGAGAEGSSRACALAPHTVEARGLADRHGHVGLLRCAIEADSVEMRTCCARSFGVGDGSSLASILGDPAEFPASEGEPLFASIVDHTFRPLSLPVEQQDVASALDSDAEVNRRWAVEFGCALVPEPELRRSVVEGMIPIIEGGTCNLSEAAQYAFLEPTQWVYLCDDIVLNTEVSAEKAVCGSFTASLVERAVGEASNKIHAAARARFMADAATELERPYRGGGGGGGGYKKDGSNIIVSAYDAHYDVVGGKKMFGRKPPTGSMCNKVVSKPNPAYRLGSKTISPTITRNSLVPCSSIRNENAGMSLADLLSNKKKKIGDVLGGDFESGLNDRQKREADEKMSNRGKGMKEAREQYRDGLKDK